MVMHARKYPRLNDGYYERGQAHPGEGKAAPKNRPSSQYATSEHYPEKGREAMSFNRHRAAEESSSARSNSPRYQNKTSYKEKGLEAAAHSNHASTSSERRPKPVGSNGAKSSREQRERDHRVEVQRSAIHQCGDWTEHRSSSGKRYYYNCKTEQSQWEKPKEWAEQAHRLKEAGKERPIKPDARLSHSNDRADHRHGNKSSSSVASWSRSCVPHSDPFAKCAKQRRSAAKSSSSDNGDLQAKRLSHDSAAHFVNASAGSNGLHAETRSRLLDDPAATLKHSDNAQAELHPASSADDMDISPGSTPTDESMMERGILPTTPSPRGSAVLPPPLSSSLPTASPSTPLRLPFGVKNSAAMLSSIISLPNMPSTEAREALQKIESQQITQQAIHTLQKIQQALLAEQQQQQRQLLQLLLQQLQTQIQHQKKQPPTSSSSSSSVQPAAPCSTTLASMSGLLVKPPSHETSAAEGSPDSDGTPLQSPEQAPSQAEARLQEDNPTRLDASPRSDTQSLKSALSSPAPGMSCTGGTVVQSGVSQLMAHRKQEPHVVGLTLSLANYVNPKLMEHVSGWLIDPLEVQANRLAEDSHTIGSIGCAQVSGELKQARSLVRITEIEATLHEQRVLFMRQQIKDLEAMRSLSSPFISHPSSSSSISAVPPLSFKTSSSSSPLEHR